MGAVRRHTKGTQDKRPMTEILDRETLAILDAFEEGVEVPDFDADEVLDDEA